jgi:N-acetylmuramoyl-L-alanine amidase
MYRWKRNIAYGLLVGVVFLNLSACQEKEKVEGLRALPDLSEHARTYMTVENTKVRTGPGPQFKVIADVPADAKVTAVGRDGDWLLIVSKKGNAPGFIEMASVQGGGSERRDSTRAAKDGKYQTSGDTQVRSGPGVHYPVVADLTKGTKITVVANDNGWLKVESKRGNKPGYVDASFARPTEEP